MNADDETPSEEFQRKLHVPKSLAERLLAGELTRLEEVACVPFDELLEASRLSRNEAMALRRMARLHLDNENE